MRIHIEADPEELRTRGPVLLVELAKSVESHSAELAASLRKAAEPALLVDATPPELKHLALKESHDRVRKLYADAVEGMIAEIVVALGEHVDGIERS